MLAFRLVHESESWLVIDKPAGFHTHPPENKEVRISPRWNALAIAERQFQRELFPAHRLDRATSGLLLFSKKRECNRALQEQFSKGQVRKTYYALVRGEFVGSSRIEQPLKDEGGSEVPATTLASASFSFTLPISHPSGGNRRFTVVEVRPETGRYHQIRRHLAHLGFPLLGDSRHGDKRLNREFTALTGCDGLFLRAMGLRFHDPDQGREIALAASWHRSWHKLFEIAGACAVHSRAYPKT